jgi:hypothetical protein
MSLAIAKNAINSIIGKCTKITVTATGSRRGSTAHVVVPDNCVFIYTNGFVAVNNISPTTINFFIEGGSSEWEGALIQDGIHPYYSAAQMSVLSGLINYCTALNRNLYVDSDIFI